MINLLLKIFKITGLVFLLLLGLILTLSSCFLQFRVSDKKAIQDFEKQVLKPSFKTYNVNNRTIHYAEIGNDTLPMILFIHGSPGSWNAFEGFFKDSSLLTKVHLVAVDRPGYGYSGFGKKEESLILQASYFKPILDQNKSKHKPILVGHSYGGPLIARMAMDYPDQVGGLIFVAPSIDPNLEPEKWIQKPAAWWGLRWLVPRAIRVSNEEILALKPELKAMLPLWKNIKTSVVFIQGGKDNLVHPDNAFFARKMLENASLKMVFKPELNHFIPWTQPELIKQAIDELVNEKAESL